LHLHRSIPRHRHHGHQSRPHHRASHGTERGPRRNQRHPDLHRPDHHPGRHGREERARARASGPHSLTNSGRRPESPARRPLPDFRKISRNFQRPFRTPLLVLPIVRPPQNPKPIIRSDPVTFSHHLTALAVLFSLVLTFPAAPAAAAVPDNPRARVADAYGKLPLSFERNEGQTAEKVAYLSRGRGTTLFL